ncbi:metallophosphoesterase [Chryseobacterium lathyri]|jgi:hypothetical protein|uniref:Calcineurin-like phosphoesterase domain-containing protein n=1 Tax=Chryseobacterium lathyri TaxID=395933 RepID=A0A511YEQ2_9FLAO|nr:metallophosphoesterase [Chryseobacterium lathyri]GEN73674.1 hypothetical protein CLA01_37460 [Chryseobacterium lathyri]
MLNWIITDLHEDIHSLKMFFEMHSSCNRASKVYSLGDNIGFSSFYEKYESRRDANSCIEMLLNNDIKTVKGNHELNFLKIIPKIPFFIYPEKQYIANEKIISDNIWSYQDEFVTNLHLHNFPFINNSDDIIIDNNILYSHFLYPDFNGNLVLNKTRIDQLLPVHFLFMEVNKIKISFVGHTHIDYPLIVSSTKRKIKLNDREFFFLDPKENYIIFCPPLNSYFSDTSKFLSYCDDTGILTFYSLGCKEA